MTATGYEGETLRPGDKVIWAENPVDCDDALYYRATILAISEGGDLRLGGFEFGTGCWLGMGPGPQTYTISASRCQLSTPEYEDEWNHRWWCPVPA